MPIIVVSGLAQAFGEANGAILRRIGGAVNRTSPPSPMAVRARSELRNRLGPKNKDEEPQKRTLAPLECAFR